MSPSDAQVIGGVLVLVVIAVNYFIGQHNRRLERIDDQERRARDKADQAAQAAQIKQEVADRAAAIVEKLGLQDEVKRLRDEKAHAETLDHIRQTNATAHEAVEGAKAAYVEANHVNLKIADTNKAIEVVQAQLERTLTQLPVANGGTGPPLEPVLSSPGLIKGIFGGKAER